jgi:hypothetical protein
MSDHRHHHPDTWAAHAVHSWRLLHPLKRPPLIQQHKGEVAGTSLCRRWLGTMMIILGDRFTEHWHMEEAP